MAELQNHSERDHATWSASSTERNWACAGSIALTDGLPETESEAAAWGTACHTISERVLRGKGPADKYLGEFIKTKSHSIEVDEEMVETSEVYTNYVVSVLNQEDENVGFWIEQHFTLNSLKPPFDAGGTADAVIYLPKAKLIEVIDLKGGRGVVVEVKGNPQARTYALGAMLANAGLDMTHIRTTIVQPRAPHKDGRIRSETFHIADLVEWTADMLEAMRRAAQASYRYKNLGGSSIIRADWAETHLTAGDHCKFCKAKATCPAIEAKTLATVGAWFDPSGLPQVAEVRSDDTPAQRAMKLDLLDMIEGWIAAYREAEHRRTEAGDPAEGYILVPAQKREAWNEGVEEQVLAAAKQAGLAPAKYLNPAKLRTPKQIRKELGEKASLIADLSSTPVGGTNLVRATKTTRAPVLGTAARFFEPQPEGLPNG